MAREDWGVGGGEFWDLPSPELREVLFVGPSTDQYAQSLMFDALVNNNQGAYTDLVEYLAREYDIDFEDAFEWIDFREWYENQA